MFVCYKRVACQPINSLLFFFFLFLIERKRKCKITTVGKHTKEKKPEEKDISYPLISIFLLRTTMSYFDKKRKYTEIYSKTEHLRGYSEEKVNLRKFISFNLLYFSI
jgi:hypothetical protein